MLAAGTINARICSTAELAAAPRLLEALRCGDLHGKAVIRMP